MLHICVLTYRRTPLPLTSGRWGVLQQVLVVVPDNLPDRTAKQEAPNAEDMTVSGPVRMRVRFSTCQNQFPFAARLIGLEAYVRRGGIRLSCSDTISRKWVNK